MAEISKYWRFLVRRTIELWIVEARGKTNALLAVEGDGAGLDFSLLWIRHTRHFTTTGWERRRRTLTSTLLPQRTMGMFSQTRSRSRCQLGTFLYVILDVTCSPRLIFELLHLSRAQNQTTHVEHDDTALSLLAATWSACGRDRGRSQCSRGGRVVLPPAKVNSSVETRH